MFAVIKMKQHYINVSQLKELCPLLNAGDVVILSGEVYTARDAAHKRMFEMMDRNEKLPIDINGSVIYYAGPTPTPDNMPIGSCGPTTSSRMDKFAPKLYDMGLTATIGKGQRSAEVVKAINRNKGVYLCAIGGAGALAAQCITECDVIAFDDLGCESIKKLVFKEFPLIVGIDCNSGSLFK